MLNRKFTMLEINTCDSGHTTLLLRLCDCPACRDEREAEIREEMEEQSTNLNATIDLWAAASRRCEAQRRSLARELDELKEIVTELVTDLYFCCECSEEYKSRNIRDPHCHWCFYSEKTKSTITDEREQP